jgi:hypothetical protein
MPVRKDRVKTAIASKYIGECSTDAARWAASAVSEAEARRAENIEDKS